MENELNSIQSLVKKRAEKRLNDDIYKMSRHLRENVGWLNFIDDTNRIGKFKEIHSAFWNQSSEGFIEYKKHMLKKYIEREAEELLKDIDSLKKENEELTKRINDIEHGVGHYNL